MTALPKVAGIPRPAVLWAAAAPTARATPWMPLIVLGAGLMLVAALSRTRDSASEAVLAMGAAGIASALVLGLHDRGDALVATTPVSRLTRRLLRLALVAMIALPIWLLVTLLLPGEGAGLLPLLALTSTGLAAATWLPVERGALPAAALPLVWVTADRLLAPAGGSVADVTGAWQSHSWPVAIAGVVLVALGRHR